MNPDEIKIHIEREMRRIIPSPFHRYHRLLTIRISHFVKALVSSNIVKRLLGTLRDETRVLKKYDEAAGGYILGYQQVLENNPNILGINNRQYGLFAAKEIFDNKFSYLVKEIFQPLQASNCSLLEVGAGELTTLVPLVQRLTSTSELAALELSWSRIAAGERFAKANGINVDYLFAGSAVALPLSDNSFDIVYTSHCLEQIPMDVETVLKELVRVSRKYVILLEPSYELGDRNQKARMRHMHYTTNLLYMIKKLGLNLIRHELLPIQDNWLNQNACYVLQKSSDLVVSHPRSGESVIACPACKNTVDSGSNLHFCAECGRIYPIVNGIHCMAVEHGILASNYLSHRDD